MSHWTPNVSNMTIMLTGAVQGIGQGMIMVPLTTLSLSTLTPRHRAEGAGVYNLARNLGSSVGVSVVNSLLTYNVQVNHAEITNDVTAFNRLLNSPHVAAFWSPFTAGGRAALDAVINQQAQIIAYDNDFKFLMCATLVTLPLLLLMRKPKRLNAGAAVSAE
jgi:DHA2 family multidrug resistance protein